MDIGSEREEESLFVFSFIGSLFTVIFERIANNLESLKSRLSGWGGKDMKAKESQGLEHVNDDPLDLF